MESQAAGGRNCTRATVDHCKLRHSMSSEQLSQISAEIRAAIRRARGYADFFGWATNRDLEEQGVITSLAESMDAEGALFFSQISLRGRGNDPPDLEARAKNGNRIAFEVTELVDGDAIKAFKGGRPFDSAEWDKAKFIGTLEGLLVAKNNRFEKLKGGPYTGGYVVVIFTGEPELPRLKVAKFLENHVFAGPPNISRAFLLLSYDPSIERCPHFELTIDAQPLGRR